MTAPLDPDTRSRITNRFREVLDNINRVNASYDRLNNLLREHSGHPQIVDCLAAAADTPRRVQATEQLDRVLSNKISTP